MAFSLCLQVYPARARRKMPKCQMDVFDHRLYIALQRQRRRSGDFSQISGMQAKDYADRVGFRISVSSTPCPLQAYWRNFEVE
jgi:hypothetical protein